MEEYKKEGIQVTMESGQLQGDSRVVVEGLLTQQQCDDFVELARVCVKTTSSEWITGPCGHMSR